MIPFIWDTLWRGRAKGRVSWIDVGGVRLPNYTTIHRPRVSMAKMATNYRVPDDSSSVIMRRPLYCRESKIERLEWMQGDCLSFLWRKDCEELWGIATGFQDCSYEICTYVQARYGSLHALRKRDVWVGFVSERIRRHCVDTFKKKLCVEGLLRFDRFSEMNYVTYVTKVRCLVDKN